MLCNFRTKTNQFKYFFPQADIHYCQCINRDCLHVFLSVLYMARVYKKLLTTSCEVVWFRVKKISGYFIHVHDNHMGSLSR